MEKKVDPDLDEVYQQVPEKESADIIIRIETYPLIKLFYQDRGEERNHMSFPLEGRVLRVGYRQAGHSVTARLFNHDPGFPWILTEHPTLDSFLSEDQRGIAEFNALNTMGVEILRGVQRSLGQAQITYRYKESAEVCLV